MNYLLLGYLVGFLGTLGDNEKIFSVQAEVDRRNKEHSSLRQNVQLDNWGLFSTFAPEPEFVGGISSIKVIAGKEAVLRCVVENLGDRKVMWQKVDSKKLLSMGTNVFVRPDRFQVTTSNSTSWFLLIKNVTLEDSGYYACQINTSPMKTIPGYLDVVEPPEFVTNMTHRNVTVMENSNVTLPCKATGKPAPVIKWRREDGQSFIVGGKETREYENEELRFIGVSREHMAAYLCVASNEVPPAISRRIYLDVKFPPLIWIQNNLVGARENIDVNLECQTEGHPLTDNYWLRDDEPVVSKSSRYQSHLARNFYKSYMRLTIRNLQPEDYGSYQCVAKNLIGETQGTIKLFRQHLPTPPSPKPVTEMRTIFPTRRVVTVSSTTEKKIFIADIERIENVHTPGNQQKYGDGGVVPDVENTSIRTDLSKSSIILVYCVHLLLTYIVKSR